MKRTILYSIVSVAMLMGCTADLEDQVVSVKNGDISNKIINSSQGGIDGSLLVRFNPSAESRLAECVSRSGNSTRTGLSEVDALLEGIECCQVKPVFTMTEKNREKLMARGMHLWYSVKFDAECNIDEVATKLAKIGDVKFVEFKHRIKHIGTPKAAPLKARPTSTTRATAQSIPFNDVERMYQWSLCNADDNPAIPWEDDVMFDLIAPVAEADVNVVPAWKLCKGDPSIVVAVVDEGVMYSHIDLADNMWKNSLELTGNKGVDDDRNGFVDDIYGYNFVYNNGNISWTDKDDTGHGTHVAGIISAVNNNFSGISSIAGGSGNKDGVKIMSLQIFSGESSSDDANTADAIIYAADNGAHILQCSWGYVSGDFFTDAEFRNDRYVGVTADAIEYFIANAGGGDDSPIDGGLVIFAAGNDGEQLISYPAGYEPCIAVGAYGPSLRLAYYSNFGPGTDIMAPGGDAIYTNGAILSTVPDAFSDPSIKGYALMQGTSQACPHVSGVAALGLSYAKQLGKRYSAQEFRSMLLSATNDIEPYQVGSVTGIPWDNNTTKNMTYSYYKGKKWLGTGYIDAYKLLLQIDGTPYTVVTQGEESSIDLAPYFGDGVYSATLKEITISDDDKNSIGFGSYSYQKGKLLVNCTKSGAATISVTLNVGGTTKENSYPTGNPVATQATKTFVLISRSAVASNNGWL